MKLLEVNESQKDDYNRFVMNNETGSFLQSWEWGEWQSALGRQVKRFKLQVESGEIVGTIQLIKMPLPLGQFYLYAPYGPVADLRLKIEDLRFLIEELKLKFSDAIFIRVESKSELNIESINHQITKSRNIQPGSTLLVDLLKSEEEILAQMHPKTRYNIRLAEKHGVEVQKEFAVSAGHGLYFKEAVDLIVETAKRQGFKTFPKSYYEKFVDFFALHHRDELKVHLYKAVYKGELLSSAIMVDFGNIRTYLFGGSSRENKNVMAPYFLHWRAIMDAKNAGLAWYDFWGAETASGKTPGFVRFKQGFAKTEKKYAGAYDIIFNPGLFRAYKLFRSLKNILK